MKPYSPYMGSQAKIAERVARIMAAQPHQSCIEAFAGAASVFFAKEKAPINVLNDVDPDVIWMHQSVATDPEGVMSEMKRLPVSRVTYEQIRAQRDSAGWHDLSDVQRAARMIYLFCCAINAKPDAPFPASATRPINFNPDKDLRPHAMCLRGVTFECLDWSELLDRYALKPNSISALVYCDPPFVVADTHAHYRYRFTSVDHLLLARKLALINERNDDNRDVKILVSYDDDPDGYIRTLYRPDLGWCVRQIDVQYRGGHHAHATSELLITNFEIGAKL